MVALAAHLLAADQLAEVPRLAGFTHGVAELLSKMWWGLLLGIVAITALSHIPREIVMSALGTKPGIKGLLRAAGAGLLLDLCNHGILMVGAKLYERGASYGQLLTFLIASPWNSLSTTLVLIALIGLPWTLAFIVLSMFIALVSGLIADAMTARGKLPGNPNRIDLPDGMRPLHELRLLLKAARWDAPTILAALRKGLSESRMVLRWIFFGVVLAALIRAVVDEASFASWFAPTMAGLSLTLIAATLIEVCSEGSSPIAADLMTRAHAPGNSFTFLMAGAATDYTEIMVLKETTRSWKMALFLPAVTVPQVLLIGWMLNLTAR